MFCTNFKFASFVSLQASNGKPHLPSSLHYNDPYRVSSGGGAVASYTTNSSVMEYCVVATCTCTCTCMLMYGGNFDKQDFRG